jgi:hypothetical protein
MLFLAFKGEDAKRESRLRVNPIQAPALVPGRRGLDPFALKNPPDGYAK